MGLATPHLEETNGQILGHASDPEVGCVHARPRDSLVELKELLALLKGPEEGRQGAHIHRMASDGQKVVEHARDLTRGGAQARFIAYKAKVYT